MCRKLFVFVLVVAVVGLAVSAYGQGAAETIIWDFENGESHGFALTSLRPATPAADDPTTAGDESLTGVGGPQGLPDAGIAWTIGQPDMYNGLKPAVVEGRNLDENGLLKYGASNPYQATAPEEGKPFDFKNPRGQVSYLNTYCLNEYGDYLHTFDNDQIATSPPVLLQEGAILSVWSLGGGSGTLAPELDPNPDEGYADDSSGIAVRSVETGELLASVLTQNHRDYAEDVIDLSAFAGQTVYIDVVDAFEGGWGWISVDEIQITNASVVKSE